MSLQPGTILAKKFEIIEPLGRGGQGLVYKAVDKDTGRVVALKLVPEEVVDNQKAMSRLLREFNLADRLTHQCIVKPLHFESHSTPKFFVMDYVPGVTLAELQQECENQAFPLPRAIQIIRKVAEALDFAHSHGVVHRDIKPHNILIGADEEVRVTDFGIGDEIRTYYSQIVSRPYSSGTLPYMSPEQYITGNCDGKTDIYALAILFYEMMTGNPPYPTAGLCTQLSDARPDPIPNFSFLQMWVIYKALRYDKKKRFGTCREFVDAIDWTSNPFSRKIPSCIWLSLLNRISNHLIYKVPEYIWMPLFIILAILIMMFLWGLFYN